MGADRRGQVFLQQWFRSLIFQWGYLWQTLSLTMLVYLLSWRRRSTNYWIRVSIYSSNDRTKHLSTTNYRTLKQDLTSVKQVTLSSPCVEIVCFAVWYVTSTERFPGGHIINWAGDEGVVSNYALPAKSIIASVDGILSTSTKFQSCLSVLRKWWVLLHN